MILWYSSRSRAVKTLEISVRVAKSAVLGKPRLVSPFLTGKITKGEPLLGFVPWSGHPTGRYGGTGK
jgi:hypothetical protein